MSQTNSHNTSSSLSSAGTVSSMETLPTQDVVDGFFDEHEEADENPEIVWGRLLPVGKTFVAVGRSFFVVPKFDVVKKCNALSKVPV